MHLRQKHLWVAAFVFFSTNIFLAGFLVQQNGGLESIKPLLSRGAISLATEDFSGFSSKSFSELSNTFSNLAKDRGGAYAFEVLKQAPVAPGTDMHLLGHVVGDILYTQEGLDGIKVCTHDFRNACSHTIVIGSFLEKGEDALDDISAACRKAPGGPGAYTMCFHGLGHGVLSYAGYRLEKAAELCNKTGSREFNNRESAECIGGTIMEMINGVYDTKVWEEQRGNYFKSDDPLYPCSADFMPDEARYMCYVYLTPHLFEAAGASLASPTTENYIEAFQFCDNISRSYAGDRDACYGGFGKEFVVLAQNRDIRIIEDMTDKQLESVYELCLFADNDEGVLSCIRHATNSLYWGGENDSATATKFCSFIASNTGHQEECFNNLIGAVQAYIRDDSNYKKEFCKEIPADYQEKCEYHLL